MNNNSTRHTGRGVQIIIYLGKLFRMFIFQNDWKVLPMAAIIAGLVSFVVGRNLFSSMEGTIQGSFAISCVCIWNGFFNSIQVICRERPIIKREHRSGLHMSSYVLAHMIYQAFLCILQAVITVFICSVAGVKFPDKPLFTPYFYVDFAISVFLITYASDMIALWISSFVHSTTTAMTLMPFLLIFQLIFSGGFFNLSGPLEPVQYFTVSKWGLTAICAQGDYNSLRMVSVWNNLVKVKDLELPGFEGQKPMLMALRKIEQEGRVEEFQLETAKYNAIADYEHTQDNVAFCWYVLILYAMVFACLSIISLEFIDRDRR